MAVVLSRSYRTMTKKEWSGAEKGGMAIMAVIVLTCVSVLGYAMSRMHTRGADISFEVTKDRLLSSLVELGLDKAMKAFDELNGSCAFPEDFVGDVPEDFVGDVPGFGWVDARFQRFPGNTFQVKVTGIQGVKTQQTLCQITCTPVGTGVPCPAWMTPEACSGGGGGGGSSRPAIQITSCLP